MTEAANPQPPHAKLVGGVWLPETEQHFVEMMTKNAKNKREVDGKLTYQYRKLEAAMKHIPQDRRRRCLDVGAHVGLWAMWLTREFEHVECFEPMPQFAAILPFNMPRLNYTLHPEACGDADRWVAFKFEPHNTGHSHVIPGAIGGIHMRTIDSYGFEQVDFIKIDVEGFELGVVQGARETLLRCKPYMVLEQKGNDAAVMGGARNEALAWCKALGMKAEYEIGGDWFLSW